MGRSLFVLRHARREARSTVRRIGVFMTSISLGVGALVAIHGFRDDVARSVQQEAEVLLGANVRITSSRPFPDSVTRVVDSLVAGGARRADVFGTASMVLAPRTGEVRLLQVRGVEGGWPFFGRPRTEPAGVWGRHLEPGVALVDPAVLTQLGIAVGDSVMVGDRALTVEGTVADLPTEMGFQSAIGPRIWIDVEELQRSGILGFGSLARYRTFLTVPTLRERIELEERYRSVFRETDVDFDTAEEEARSLSVGVEYLGRYLGLVGLAALLLGGIGVASAVHVFVREKLTTVAVLRCLGARQWTAFLSYLVQAAALGLVGSLVGVALGLAAQRALLLMAAGALPVDIESRIAVVPALAGLAIGLWVSILFALVPLLAVRDVPPLRALRSDVEGRAARWDPWRIGAWAALFATVAALSAYEAPEADDGLVFAGGLTVTAAILWATAWLLVRAARRFVPSRAPYPLRQGIANLHRPRNQTLPVTLALGFGVFVVATVLQVQASLTSELRFDAESDRPNLLLFDIQPDQIAGVLDLLPESGRVGARVTPIVPSRLSSIGGRSLSELRADTTAAAPRGWALRREYRHTYRADLTDSEELVAGTWWDEVGPEPGPHGTPERPTRISLEVEIATDLGVGLGDTLAWDVAGREVTTVVTSVRQVDWGRFDTNFFVVFEPGILESAPHMNVLLTRLEDEEERLAFQRRLRTGHPNVSVLDVTRVREVVESILDKVSRAIRFLALFSAVAGLLVLGAALATSRYQRMREVALLRTLGARRRQVLAVLVTEYVALGALASLTGLALGTWAAALVVSELFDMPFTPALVPAAAVGLVVTLMTLITGVLGSRGILSRPPLPTLREAGE